MFLFRRRWWPWQLCFTRLPDGTCLAWLVQLPVAGDHLPAQRHCGSWQRDPGGERAGQQGVSGAPEAHLQQAVLFGQSVRLAVCREIVGQDHPTMAALATAILALHEGADSNARSVPGLFDDLPASSLTDAHLSLAGCSDGDRMMVSCFLPVPATAKVISSVLLRRGWSCSMGWSEVAGLCDVDVPAVSRAVKSLEQAGILRRRKLSRSGRGFAGYELVFDGLAICRLIDANGYAALLPAARGVLEYHRMLPPVDGSRLAESATPSVNGVIADESRVADLPTRELADGRLAELTTPDRGEGRVAESATPPSDKNRLAELATPATNEGRLVESATPYDDDDLNKKENNLETSSFSSGQSIPDPGGAELTRPQVVDSGVVDSTTRPVLDSGVADSATPLDCLPAGKPGWHNLISAGLGSKKTPDLPAMLALQARNGWPDSLMAETAEQYVRSYGSQQVKRPDSLFARVAESMAGSSAAAGAAPDGVSDGISDDAQSGGESSEQGGSDSCPITEKQKVSVFRDQRRLALSDEDIAPLWPEIYPGSVGVDPFRVDSLSMSQAFRLVGWLIDQPDPSPSGLGPAVQAMERACCCEDIRAVGASHASPDETAVGMWEGALGLLSVELPATTFDTWLKCTSGVRIAGSDLVVAAPSVFNVAWIEQRMYQTVLRAVRDFSGTGWDVQFEASGFRERPVHGAVLGNG